MFKCYLSNRMFSLNTESSFSNKVLIHFRVIQRSILGPLLFLLYLNDMVQTVNCDLLLYSDRPGPIF